MYTNLSISKSMVSWGEVIRLNYESIADARNDLGLTQNDMADQLGITRQTYAKMEQHPEDMTIREARLVCSVLGRRFEDIFFGSMVNTNSPMVPTTS